MNLEKPSIPAPTAPIQMRTPAVVISAATIKLTMLRRRLQVERPIIIDVFQSYYLILQ